MTQSAGPGLNDVPKTDNVVSSPMLVYVAGTGRSGSTLLDVLIGSHPLAFGAGELASLFWQWSRGERCSCGELYPECSFWGNVIDHLQKTLPDLTPAAAEQLTRRVEAITGPWRAPQVSRVADPDAYNRLWSEVFASVGRESGASFIVDSSKSSRVVARRIRALERLGGFDLSVIHLVRDPRALMWSALRGSNRLLEIGQQGTFRGGAYRALIGWGLANASVHMTHATSSTMRFMRLRYEDMVANPIQTLRDIADFLELDLEPVVELVAGGHPLDPGHGVGGNRMRRQGPIQIKTDHEWHESLPRYGRILASLSWPLAHQYGYEVIRSSSPQ